MRKGNSACLQKNVKPFRLNNYTSWFHSKQKTEALIQSLQTQNKNLIAKNIQLQKQNHELFLFKEKYMALNPEQNKEANLTEKKERTLTLSSYADKKYSNSYVAETNEGSMRKGKPILLFKQSQDQQGLDQKLKMQILNGEINGSAQTKTIQKKKRFNYFSDPDLIPSSATLEILTDTSQPIFQSSQRKALQNSYGKQPSQSIHVQNKIAQKPIFASVSDSKLEICSVKPEALVKQLLQMRKIQQKLLDRIAQRDQIIGKLQNLLHSPQQPCENSK